MNEVYKDVIHEDEFIKEKVKAFVSSLEPLSKIDISTRKYIDAEKQEKILKLTASLLSSTYTRSRPVVYKKR